MAGDVLMVQPQNNPALVSAFLHRIGLAPEAQLLITPDNKQLGQVSSASLMRFPDGPISAKELFSFWLNLSEPPTRYFCAVIGHFLQATPGREL